jgi:hypothetical protein
MELSRADIINAFIRKFNYSSYLEIGVESGYNMAQVKSADKTGVDPDVNSKATIHKTSDEFFATNERKFDLIFIDGLHEAWQVEKDIDNALKFIEQGGTIVMHDCLPPDEATAAVPRIQQQWTGDVYKAFLKFRSKRKDLEMFTVDTDFGCGVIRLGKQETISLPNNVSWNDFISNKEKWMNIKSCDQFLNYVELL